MDFSPAVGILHSFIPRGSPSPCCASRGMTLERKYSVGDSKNAADEFSEKGRSADGGLRNGDLLTLKSANATILPTASCDPENLSPRGFNPHSCLFLLAARQSVQAPSALAPQRRLRYFLTLKSSRNFCLEA